MEARLNLDLIALTSKRRLSSRDEAPLHPNGGSMGKRLACHLKCYQRL
jgi:hypothetical protein